MWETLLEGTLILGILTTIIGILKDKTDRKLQYITSERGKWRNEIREISQKLQNAEECEINKILCELKVKINTYGIANEDNIFQDAHIWKIIRTLENPQGSNVTEKENEIKKAKRTLIKYLSCLLKNDWERSKGEVVGNHTILLDAVVNIFFFVGVIFCCNLSFNININGIDINQIKDWTFIFTIIFAGCLAVINFIVFCTQIKMTNISEYFIKDIKAKRKFWGIKGFIPYIIYITLWQIYLLFVFSIQKFFKEFLEDKKEILFTEKEFVLFVIWTIIYLFILYCVYYLKVSNEKKNYIDYYNTINKIYEIEMCPSACTREDCPR